MTSRKRKVNIATPLLALTFATTLGSCTAAATEEVATQPTELPTTVPQTVPAVPAVPVNPAATFAATWSTWTPLERFAFWVMAATPDELTAFNAYINPPPPPPPPSVVSAPTQNRPKAPLPQPPAAPKAPAVTSGAGTPANSFLACVRQRESGGNYQAYNRSGAAGAFQLMPATARNTANHAGRPDLAGRPVTSWSPADQDAMAAHLYQWQGPAPWAGPGC